MAVLRSGGYPDLLEFRASPAVLVASFGGRPGTPRGQAAGRGLCRGAVRSAALRGGPAGRRDWPTPSGRAEIGKQCAARWRFALLPGALRFSYGRGQYVATLVQWPFDCPDSHSV
jgi:hypothetical protein